MPQHRWNAGGGRMIPGSTGQDASEAMPSQRAWGEDPARPSTVALATVGRQGIVTPPGGDNAPALAP
ncbi:hypothetical protein [Sphingobium sp. CECT 9361]|uniref:hypothetical protein n=1 Tax=Sphingobium sp. CECT 9361 TaxID=2845384 RepID=UPI001E60FDBB|nr:hypothetical protein [Sphingobium sp. CECT 9361]CAH0356343.1 hypothetical protein SPH9361_04014 [Sphingobium sp. CECT 9361]